MAQEIAVTLRLKDLLTGPLSGVRENLQSIQARFRNGLDPRGFAHSRARFLALGGAALAAGGALTAGVTLPLANLGREALRTSADFESALNEVKGLAYDSVSTVGKSTAEITAEAQKNMRTLEENVSRLRKRITTEIAPGSLFSETEFARAAAKLAASGYKPDAIGDMLPAASTAAVALQAPLTAAADGISAAAASFGYEKSDTSAFRGFSALFGLVAARTRAELETLTQAYKYAGSTARQTGFSKEGVGAGAGFLANAGLEGSEIGTGLRAMMSQVARWFSTQGPNENEVRVFNRYGIRRADFMTMENGKSKRKDLDEILAMFQSKKVKSEDYTTLFGIEAFGKALTLQTAMKDVKTLKTELQEAFSLGSRGARTAVDDMASLMGTGLNSKMKRLENSWEALKRAIGDSGLLDAASSFVDVLTRLVTRLRVMNPTLLQWGVFMGGLAVVLGPVVLAFGAMVTAGALLAPALAALGFSLGGLVGTMAAVVAGLAALGTGLFLLWKDGASMRDAAQAWWDEIREQVKERTRAALEAIRDAVGSLIAGIGEGILAAWRGVSEKLRTALTLGRVAESVTGLSLGAGALSERLAPLLAPSLPSPSASALPAPAAPLLGGREREALNPSAEPLSARLSVDFRNAPVGTRVRADAPRGVTLDTRLGIIGASP